MAEDLDPFTAEQLLRGEFVDGPLAELLAAAAEPAYEDELAGEDLAVAAFHSARVRRPARTYRLKAAIAVLAVAGTGAAAAAATGVLPVLRGSQHGPSIEAGQGAPSQQASAGTGTGGQPTQPSRVPPSRSQTQPTSPAKPSSAPTSRPSKRPTSQPPHRPTSPTMRPPSASALVGLCRSYTAGGPRNDNSLDNPAFTVLVTIAGGKERVRGYCERLLLNQMPTPPHGRAPSYQQYNDYRSGRPTAHPSNRPTIPPAGVPATAPTPRAW